MFSPVCAQQYSADRYAERAVATDGVRIRVLAADDHPVVRAGIAAMLANEPDIDVVGLAGNGAEAVTLFEAEQQDNAAMLRWVSIIATSAHPARSSAAHGWRTRSSPDPQASNGNAQTRTRPTSVN